MDTQDRAIAGEGSQTQGTYEAPFGSLGGNYANLNSNDGDAQVLVFRGLSTSYHCYDMQDFSGGAITNVRLSTVARVGAVYYNYKGKIRNYCRIDSVNHYGDSYDTSTSYTTYTTDWAVNPATGFAWTQAELNAAEFGFEIVVNYSPSASLVTYMVQTVAYTPLLGRSFGCIIG